MKKILIIMVFSMLSVLASAQVDFEYKKISETELGDNTVEHSVRELNEMGQYQIVLDCIEAGTLDKYIQTFRDMGDKTDTLMAYKINAIRNNLSNKFYFITNGKLYIMTYEPTPDIIVDNTQTLPPYKNLYLYRRDVDGWKIASDLIRTDYFSRGDSMKVLEPYMNTWGRNVNSKFVIVENIKYGEVKKTSTNVVYITFETTLWNPNKTNTYNSIAIFVPNGDETYSVACYEPKNIVGKIVKNITYSTYDYKKMERKEKIGTLVFPVLYGTRNTDYMELSDGNSFLIKYWDGNNDNPVLAGSVNFMVENNSVFVDNGTTILLNKLK